MSPISVIDVGPLRTATASADDVMHCAAEIDAACREVGFFLIDGHGIEPKARDALDLQARAFFALDNEEKSRISMIKAGRAWRGWFAEGAELTSGKSDHKEGIYFGTDLPADDARVRAGLPLHGANLYPDRPEGLRSAVDAWMDEVTRLGHDVLSGLAIGLGLRSDWFATHLTKNPTVLFRIFRYPVIPADWKGWGVGEHTDYGLITLLAQDGTPGLQVRPRGTEKWIDVPADPNLFVVNLGDMVEAMTGGRYRSTPHRVRVPDLAQAPSTGRLSFPLFLDPSFDAEIAPIPLRHAGGVNDDPPVRWDGVDLATLDGTYGEYLVSKVAKVFPKQSLTLPVHDGPPGQISAST